MMSCKTRCFPKVSPPINFVVSLKLRNLPWQSGSFLNRILSPEKTPRVKPRPKVQVFPAELQVAGRSLQREQRGPFTVQ